MRLMSVSHDGPLDKYASASTALLSAGRSGILPLYLNTTPDRSTWSCRFSPTPGRFWTTSIPRLRSAFASPTPESIRSFGLLMAPAADFIGQLASATDDLDIGLVVSNAGTGNPGEFLKLDRQLLQATLRLNTMAHLDIPHHFGAKLAERRRGGLILAGAMGAENGIPCMANDGAAKAYVHSLGEALHYEFKPLGVYVTVLAAGFTNTAVLEKFGLDPKTMLMKPMSVEQCVSEALSGLLKNRSRIVPGRLNRIMNALVPASLARKMEADLLGKGLASKSAPANARAEA